MKAITITVSDPQTEEMLEAYQRDRPDPAELAAVAEAALRGFLFERGYLPEYRPVRVTPTGAGSGRSDVSVNHDRYFAEE